MSAAKTGNSHPRSQSFPTIIVIVFDGHYKLPVIRYCYAFNERLASFMPWMPMVPDSCMVRVFYKSATATKHAHNMHSYLSSFIHFLWMLHGGTQSLSRSLQRTSRHARSKSMRRASTTWQQSTQGQGGKFARSSPTTRLEFGKDPAVWSVPLSLSSLSVLYSILSILFLFSLFYSSLFANSLFSSSLFFNVYSPYMYLFCSLFSLLLFSFSSCYSFSPFSQEPPGSTRKKRTSGALAALAGHDHVAM